MFSHEYDIFNAVVRVAYSLPDDFPPMIGDLIEKLIVSHYHRMKINTIDGFFSVLNQKND